MKKYCKSHRICLYTFVSWLLHYLLDCICVRILASILNPPLRMPSTKYLNKHNFQYCELQTYFFSSAFFMHFYLHIFFQPWPMCLPASCAYHTTPIEVDIYKCALYFMYINLQDQRLFDKICEIHGANCINHSHFNDDRIVLEDCFPV